VYERKYFSTLHMNFTVEYPVWEVGAREEAMKIRRDCH
jgi:hypothetical protein